MPVQTHLDKRHRAREQDVAIAGHVYTLRRPTAAQLARLGDETQLELVRACVVGWNLTEADLYPGGAPTPAAFDAATWSDWLDDSPDLWAPLIDALLAQIAAHHQHAEDAVKN